MLRRERGAGAVFLFVVLLLAMVFLIAMFMVSRVSSNVDAQAQTKAELAAAAAALEQYAGATGSLPCPAQPDVDNGLAVPNGTANCQYPQGVLPWATIGMRRDDAIDAWGWKIAYRVYSGAGGMTQPNGASMVNCDTAMIFGSAGVDANGLCRSNHTTLPADFLAGKGLDVTDFGTGYLHTTNNGAAYVLMSLGPSGFGGYTGSGTSNPNVPKSTAEKNNLKATGPFTLMAASSPDVAPGDNNHFDDVLLYRTADDLARRANLAGRNWTDSLASTLQTVLGLGSPPSAGTDLGTSTIHFQNLTVGGTANLTYDTLGGTEGIGVSGGGSPTINGSEFVGVLFDKTARKVAISLAGFDSSESATLVFLKGGSLVGSFMTLHGCNPSVPGGGPLASFTIDPGVSFDEVGVSSWPYSSSFLLSAVKSCAATDATCVTPLDNAANHCP